MLPSKGAKMASFNFANVDSYTEWDNAKEGIEERKPAETLSGENPENITDLASAGASGATIASTGGMTGIAYFDKKIQNGNVSPYDAYLAKKYIGMDITLNGRLALDMKMQANNKSISGTPVYNEIRETISGLEITDRVIKGADKEAGGLIFSHKNAGVFGGINRWLNDKTGGLWGLNPNAKEYKNDVNTMVYSTARAQTRGKTTNMAIQDAKDAYSAGVRGVEEMQAGVNQARDVQLEYLKSQIYDAQARGYELPPEIFAFYDMQRQKSALIKQGNYNENAYKEIDSKYSRYLGSLGK